MYRLYKIEENNIIYDVEEYSNGDKIYLRNGDCHRENGPAIEWVNGENSWFINGQLIPCSSQQEFEKFKKLKGFW